MEKNAKPFLRPFRAGGAVTVNEKKKINLEEINYGKEILLSLHGRQCTDA